MNFFTRSSSYISSYDSPHRTAHTSLIFSVALLTCTHVVVESADTQECGNSPAAETDVLTAVVGGESSTPNRRHFIGKDQRPAAYLKLFVSHPQDRDRVSDSLIKASYL